MIGKSSAKRIHSEIANTFPPNDRKRKSDSQVPIDLINSENLVCNLFGGDDLVDRLKAQHFQCRPFVHRGSVARLSILKELLNDFDVLTLVQGTASEKIHVWLPSKSEDGSLGLESITVDDPVAAMKLYNAGHSLYFRAPPELEAAVIPKVLTELGHGLIGSGSDR
jgi:hypothetical protein